MNNTVTAFPLCWPAQSPRTLKHDRVHGRFGSRQSGKWGTQNLTLAQAKKRVLEEISRFTSVGNAYRADMSLVVISSDLALRQDGYPRSGQRQPEDSGVVVYFELDDQPRCFPCDNYFRIEDNLAAIAATIQSLRTIERHGSAMFDSAFSGFTALPSPDQVAARSWRETLDYFGDSLADAKKCYLRERSKAHPDTGGSVDKFEQISRAWTSAQNDLA